MTDRISIRAALPVLTAKSAMGLPADRICFAVTRFTAMHTHTAVRSVTVLSGIRIFPARRTAQITAQASTVPQDV